MTSLPSFRTQVLGTHNSYHRAPDDVIFNSLGGRGGILAGWDYSHPSLTDQLQQYRVRAFELDAYPDPAPDSGRYDQAAGLQLAGLDGFLNDPKLSQPGYKVLHVPDFDYQTTCKVLTDCLLEIKAWSDVHPDHLPISIYIELKLGSELDRTLGATGLAALRELLLVANSTTPGPGDVAVIPGASPQLLADLESEVLQTLGASKLITPDTVREWLGASDTLIMSDLLLDTGDVCPWPPLKELRGKILLPLILPNSPAVDLYYSLYPNSVGSVFWPVQQDFKVSGAVFQTVGGFSFTAVDEAFPDKVTQLVQDITMYTEKGYIVRTRAEAELVEPRGGDVSRRDAVLASHAQVIATDFLKPVFFEKLNADYDVSFPGCAVGKCIGESLIQVQDAGEPIACGADVTFCDRQGAIEGPLVEKQESPSPTASPPPPSPPPPPPPSNSARTYSSFVVGVMCVLFLCKAPQWGGGY